jgi:NTE family protein
VSIDQIDTPTVRKRAFAALRSRGYTSLVRKKKITLVLGSGGPIGHAFHAGLLRALSDGLGWDARESELVLGTSAGAQVGALLRAGMSGVDLMARVTGESLSQEGDRIARHYTRPSHDAPAGRAPYRPASTPYLLRALAQPWRTRPGRLLAALLPRGRVSLMPQAEGLQRLFGLAWPSRPLWIAALCLHSGELTAFGRPGAPATDVGTAVACSGAVPAVCEPVHVAGRPFIDGGIASATNLELVRDVEDDLVIVSSPLSMIPPMRLLLWNEVRKLRAAGRRTVVFEPEGEASNAMGLNPMSLPRCGEVARAAYRSALRNIEGGTTSRELSSVF